LPTLAATLPPVPRPVILGGPGRYLAGNAAFKWTVFAHWSWLRAVAIAVVAVTHQVVA